jgi:glycosyltransferase involved in cell wall biosynthesis
MKLAILTRNLDENNGWGRYSISLTKALIQNGVDCTTFINSRKKCLPGLDCHAILKSREGGWKNLFLIVYDYFQLRNRIEAFDVIHAFTETDALLAYLLRKPYVLSTHGTFAIRFFKNPILRQIFKRVYLNAGRVIITSNFTYSLIEKFVTLKNRTYVMNGVDATQFRIIPGIKRDSATFVTVGALKPRKGQDLGVESVVQLVTEYPNIQFVIVGENNSKEYVEEIKAKIKKHGIEKNVIFKGRVTDEELLTIYNSATMYVQPSRVDKDLSFEGSPLTLLEASACGLPIIGTDASASAELIKDGYNGILVKHDDAQELTGAIRKILEAPDVAQKMGRNARIIAEGFSWDNNAKIVKKLYENIIRTKV